MVPGSAEAGVGSEAKGPIEEVVTVDEQRDQRRRSAADADVAGQHDEIRALEEEVLALRRRLQELGAGAAHAERAYERNEECSHGPR